MADMCGRLYTTNTDSEVSNIPWVRKLPHTNTFVHLVKCHLNMSLNSKVKSGVSAEPHWYTAVLCYWLAGSRQEQLLNTKQTMRPAGGGPVVWVAVHVKWQHAEVRHVRHGWTCVSPKRCKLMLYWLFCSCYVGLASKDITPCEST